jgi:uncharacterized hydrophobic protein (TIGR00271 family)
MEPTQDSVQFSRTQGIFSAIAVGGSIVLAVDVFIARARLIERTGDAAPLAFIIAAILFLPIILSCAQRSSGAISSASFYVAARASGSAPRLFLTGWVMLGGYLTLGAIIAWTTATRIDIGLQKIFGIDLELPAIVVLLVAGAFAKEIFSKGQFWRSRTIAFWICTILLFALVIWAATVQSRGGTTISRKEPLRHWLLAVSMLACTLWAIDIVLTYRGQLRRPNLITLWSLVAIFCGGNLLGALISLVTLHNPSLLIENWLAVLTWNQSRLELLLLFVGLLICISALLRVMTRITRLMGGMILDGALPSGTSNHQERKTLYYSGFFIAVLAYLAAIIPPAYLLITSGLAALLATALYIQPLLKRDLSRITRVKLPFHPLVPVTAIVIAIFLTLILPVEHLLIGAGFLLLGAIFYFTIVRKKMLPTMQQYQMLSAEKMQPLKTEYRVLACLNDGEINENLLRIGSSLAAAKSGEVLVLRILEISEVLPSNLQRSNGETEWSRIRDTLQHIQLPGPNAIPLVRMAPDLISGIKATAAEFDVDFELVEWPEESSEKARKNQLQSLLQLSARPLGILKGEFSPDLQKISVGCGTNAHSIFALQAGEALALVNQTKLEALKIFTKAENEDEVKQEVQSVMTQSGVRLPVEIVLREERDLEDGIMKEAESSELLLLGAADDPISGRHLPDGISMEVALQRKKATLIVKSEEQSSRFFMRRVIAQLTQRVSALTPKERSELLIQLKVGLQARTDFYLMVALAAAIAITGLIMNDGSVVLGAMLVSPLMSPIVGIACGIALGNIDLMRRSSASTFKGMALVLGMGIVMTFILPSVEPTDQILSRTHPGIYDLIAALAAGAAGAYSLGRRSVAGALPGVAMSLSLEPPLAVAGYGLSTSQFWITGVAFLLFLTNLVAIVLSGVGVYLLLGMRPPRKEDVYVVGKAVASVLVVVLILIIPLGFGTYGALQKGHLKFQVESEFRSEALREKFELFDLRISEHENGYVIHPTVLSSSEVTPGQIENFRKIIEQKIGSPIQIEATILKTKQIESPTKNPQDEH